MDGSRRRAAGPSCQGAHMSSYGCSTEHSVSCQRHNYPLSFLWEMERDPRGDFEGQWIGGTHKPMKPIKASAHSDTIRRATILPPRPPLLPGARQKDRSHIADETQCFAIRNGLPG